MTENLAKRLGLPRFKCVIPIGALNQMSTSTKHIITASILSRDGNYEKTLQFLTVPVIAGCIPAEIISREHIKIPRNLKLADPEFYKPGSIDMLLGAGPTLSLFCNSQYDLSPKEGPDLILKKTRLGWIIGGNTNTFNENTTHQTFVVTTDFDLTKFWEVEEGPRQIHFSLEEQAAEDHFTQNKARDYTGRYVVALPFKSNKNKLGESRQQALKRFYALERKLDRNIDLKEQYNNIIQEYLTLGHMSEAGDITDHGFYLPHHAVVKEDSLTTRLRIVFDGSAKTLTGISLNETLMVGPTIQDDIFSLILRFRQYQYVLTGDIEKMYRQFLVREEDRRYQRIIWRNANGEITTYELNTITFGLSAAPFLAVRCLQQLARDYAKEYPKASQILLNDMYVDDLITGFKTMKEAKEAQGEINNLLKEGGLSLRQWASNEPQLLDGIALENINQRLQLTDDKTLKTLGIVWNSRSDTISYTAKTIIPKHCVTKRTILSEVATIFDPLGLLGPLILKAKTIIQKLWVAKVDWDESIPSSIHTSWIELCIQLPQINQLTFKRQIIIDNPIDNQIHGFCDASETGYGACIYIKSVDAFGQSQVNILCSRCRVAPLKTVSLPRLELCGAYTLMSLYNAVKQAMNISVSKTILWTDSTITLQWVNTEPHTLKTFVSNRVAGIQRGTQGCEWRHIRSEDNPADALSRGQQPGEFIRNVMWQHGPDWLKGPEHTWPMSPIPECTEDLEIKKVTCLTMSIEMYPFEKFNSLIKLARVFTFCFRFIDALKHKRSTQQSAEAKAYDGRETLKSKPIDSRELNDSILRIVGQIQRMAFSKEIQALEKTLQPINSASRIITLNPFIDNKGVLRVGGRLQNSSLTFSQKHGAILPKNNHVTDLIIQHEHLSHLHAGVQTTLYALRQNYWPVDGRNQVRKNIRKCHRCCRANPPPTNYIMGNLPKARISGDIRPFMNVGVDYCGPFYIKEKKYRNRSKVKVYVAVFICMAVKAVHLELVSDLTTPGFIAALDRLIARRGKPSKMYSDNGTNFTGANNELREIVASLQIPEQAEKIMTHLTNQGIDWQFTPPLSPHFGGIWEGAVKSFKHHLVRVAGNELMTFEELNTLIIKVEAILNSRPLIPISADPKDIQVLTPGHFLIGTTLTAPPEKDLSNERTSVLSRWQLIQKMKQDFWTRWHKEYLNELNIRKKWTTGAHEIQIGSIVLLKEDNIPPMQWKLGRVIDIYPGNDQIVRVVSVKTATGVYKRNVRKLAPLPIV